MVNLSKLLSYILRHSPHDYGLTLEEEGWVDAYDLIEVIKKRHNEYSKLIYEDLVRVVDSAEKKRHEILDGRIRALYGHSLSVNTVYDEGMPPECLYHGTPRYNLSLIMEEGLKRMQRSYVHLTEDMSEAKNVGARKGRDTIVLKVTADIAWKEGVKFFKVGALWLCESIPGRYIIYQES